MKLIKMISDYLRSMRLLVAPQGYVAIVVDEDHNLCDRKEVLLTTHRRFKSLGADGLVLVGIPVQAKDDYSVADHCVACSRAKHLLEIVYD